MCDNIHPYIMRCDGPGHKPGEPVRECKNMFRTKKVRMSQGDLQLCEQCEKERFPPKPMSSASSTSGAASESSSTLTSAKPDNQKLVINHVFTPASNFVTKFSYYQTCL